MSRYMLIYNGKATDPSQMTPEQAATVMDGWRTWMASVGSALVDVGTPFGHGTSIVDDGSSADAIELSGYSIVEADSLDALLDDDLFHRRSSSIVCASPRSVSRHMASSASRLAR